MMVPNRRWIFFGNSHKIYTTKLFTPKIKLRLAIIFSFKFVYYQITYNRWHGCQCKTSRSFYCYIIPGNSQRGTKDSSKRYRIDVIYGFWLYRRTTRRKYHLYRVYVCLISFSIRVHYLDTITIVFVVVVVKFNVITINTQPIHTCSSPLTYSLLARVRTDRRIDR